MHGTRCPSEVAELLLERILVYNNFYCLKKKDTVSSYNKILRNELVT
jgi:hypothetical protein